MGSFYTNITLKGPSQEQVAGYLRSRRRDAYVSPTNNGVTIVYDREADRQLPEVLNSLSADLSSTFHCPAWWTLLHDSDVLLYALFDDGVRIDEYNSAPSYFDEDAETPTQPSGGDANKLCAAFGADHAVPQVKTLLGRWRGDSSDDGSSEGFVFEEERHWAIAEALDLLPAACTTGYDQIVANGTEELEREFDHGKVVMTLG